MNTLSRRGFLAMSGGLLTAQSQTKPHVLMICVDDLNDWIGCLGGNPDSVTPNFDRLAKQSVLFTNAHCAAPLCNPSRAALMTGIHPATSGIYQNSQPWRKSPALANARTLPQHFSDNGYKSIGGGKTYHDAFPDPDSWHEYFPSKTKQKPVDPVPAKQPANGIAGTANFDWGPLDNTAESNMGDHKVVDWAIGEMNKNHGKPLFIAVGLYKPHLPWHVPQKYFDMYPLSKITLPKINGDDLDDVPPIGVKFAKPKGDHKSVTDHGQWKQAVQAYLAAIRYCDTELGRLLDAFEKSPLAKNTIVCLWSDHGWHLGEKLHWRKFSLWEEATHNVLMMRAPGLTQPGGRCDRTVGLIDVYPTLADLAGLPAKREWEGKSLKPLLANPKAKWDHATVCTYGKDNHGVRTEDWRYIRYSDGTEELYDRRKDPLEWKNLAKDPQYGKTKTELARWLPKVNAVESVVQRGAAEN
ncbi:MAG: sulfatase [Acidobacteria bacterium]|nr:sulfatase [Acidobacteriota bacterium]